MTLKVLHVWSGNLSGGVETFLTTLARLREPALDAGLVFEFALCFEGDLSQRLRALEAIVHPLGEVRFRNPLSIRRARTRLRDLLRGGGFDAVICHAAWPHALAAPVVRREGKPLLFWMHDLAHGRLWFERLAARTPPDIAIVNSEFTATTLPRLFPKTPSRVVRYPVEFDVGDSFKTDPTVRLDTRRGLATSPDAVVILQASRLERWKGHAVFIEALSKLTADPSWTAWIAGGPQRPAEHAYFGELTQMLERLDLTSRVQLLGNRSDVPRLLAASDLFCQPNSSPEPIGLVFIEALRAGRPVLSTNIGGAAEIVDSTCGVLVPPGDPDTLSRALATLIADRSARAALGAAGPSRARALCDPAATLAELADVVKHGAARWISPATPRPTSGPSRRRLSAEWSRTQPRQDNLRGVNGLSAGPVSSIRHVITGEYPPTIGGVADYAAVVAGALAAAGVEVHVWTPRVASSRQESSHVGGPVEAVITASRVVVEEFGDGWSMRALRRLSTRLDAFPPPRRLLVQWTPNAWGWKGMNWLFCRWLVARRARGDDVRVMVHEVRYTIQPWDRPTRLLLAVVQRALVRSMMRAATHVDVTIPKWAELLRRDAPDVQPPITWRPVPSTISRMDNPSELARRRLEVAPQGESIVGCFATFDGEVAARLADVLPLILSGHSTCVALLIGRGSASFTSKLSVRHPDLGGRIIAADAIPAASISINLQACDLMVQPYPDGVSTRRTTIMASLSHGLPVVTTQGRLTEPFWSTIQPVALVPAGDAEALARRALELLARPTARAVCAEEGRRLYERCFAVERLVESFLDDATTPLNPLAVLDEPEVKV